MLAAELHPKEAQHIHYPQNQANHLHNKCEKLGESSPIAIEEIQKIPMILMARLIWKGLGKHKMELKFWIQSILFQHYICIHLVQLFEAQNKHRFLSFTSPRWRGCCNVQVKIKAIHQKHLKEWEN